ncbi:MAG: hypothetical protein BGN87_06810 [Rhizobiales bacterium 65-79]|jgi:hypothetical protein|nr:hypothetical protein [Hyphomicrobiales bacterium]OJU00995.1 MAG: hypothetical protein BGN87_06810 [Rhizobiales bacterium 65-79]
MKQSIAVSLAACAALVGTTSCGFSAEVKSVQDIGKAIDACWHPPAGGKNSTVTLRLGFKRDGSLLGPPRASSVQVKGDDKARKAYVDAAVKAVTDCTPLGFSPDIAKGMAGQIFALSFRSDGSTALAPAR